MRKKLISITLLLVSCLSIAISQTDSIPYGKVIYLQNVQSHGDINNNGYSTLLINER